MFYCQSNSYNLERHPGVTISNLKFTKLKFWSFGPSMITIYKLENPSIQSYAIHKHPTPIWELLIMEINILCFLMLAKMHCSSKKKRKVWHKWNWKPFKIPQSRNRKVLAVYILRNIHRATRFQFPWLKQKF